MPGLLTRLPRLVPLYARRAASSSSGRSSGAAAAGARWLLRRPLAAGGAAAATACALSTGGWGGVVPAQAAGEAKVSWLPAKPGGGDREMPPPDPAGRPRVIFQGELGAYGETAVAEYYDRNGAVPVPCDDFETVRAPAQRPPSLASLPCSRAALAGAPRRAGLPCPPRSAAATPPWRVATAGG